MQRAFQTSFENPQIILWTYICGFCSFWSSSVGKEVILLTYTVIILHSHFQSTHIPWVPQCLSPRPNWDPPLPLPQAIVPSRNQTGGGTHSPAGEGVKGGSQFGRLEKKPSTLPTLCSHPIISLLQFLSADAVTELDSDILVSFLAVRSWKLLYMPPCSCVTPSFLRYLILAAC